MNPWDTDLCRCGHMRYHHHPDGSHFCRTCAVTPFGYCSHFELA